jgi:uncharacterized membrane protein
MALLAMLPGRVRMFPEWVTYVIGLLVLLPTAAVGLTAGRSRWLRIEHTVTLGFFGLGLTSSLVTLNYLIQAMIRGSVEVTGLQLLASSIAVWTTNVIMFSLLYWQMDRGGPEARVRRSGPKPDWLFPEENATRSVPPDWGPTFVDYLFLAFSTATAFSTTDTLPLTARAKVLMMLESVISLVTIVAVAARAINVLGS